MATTDWPNRRTIACESRDDRAGTSMACANPDVHVAQAVRAGRDEIAASLLASAFRRHEVTVGSELLAFSFIDRFVDAIATQRWPDFFAWIESSLERHAGGEPVTRLFTLAMATIAASLPARQIAAGAMRTDFDWIAEEVRRIAERPRFARALAANTSLDEIDVALDRLMLRLTSFDAPTADHSRAVSMWCARIARKIGLSSSRQRSSPAPGSSTTLGKSRPPPEFLTAPYRLSDFEMEVMRDTLQQVPRSCARYRCSLIWCRPFAVITSGSTAAAIRIAVKLRTFRSPCASFPLPTHSTR